MALIGISGKISSGKDTVANMIKDVDGKDWVVRKFADKIKDITCMLIGCTREQLECRDFKEKELGEEWNCISITGVKGINQFEYEYVTKLFLKNDEKTINRFIEDYDSTLVNEQRLTPRLLMQLLGTEFGRNMIHPNLWVLSLFSNYIGDPYPSWIVTDVRFENEAEAIKDRGGILIRLTRNSNSENQHPSETALDDYDEWDFVIDNNGSIEELKEKVATIIGKINNPKCCGNWDDEGNCKCNPETNNEN